MVSQEEAGGILVPSDIEWTEDTLNLSTGCTKVSPGCKNCYAEIMHKRLHLMGMEKYEFPFSVVRPAEYELKKLKKTKPTIYFCNSMSDIFHEDLDIAWVHKMIEELSSQSIHKFQVLTKREKRITELEQYTDNLFLYADNIWLGVSVENQKFADDRIPHLINSSAQHRFLSCEPLIGPLDLTPYLHGLDMVIVGGESGAFDSIRKFDVQWARDIKAQCDKAGVQFFFKQAGSFLKCKDKTHKCYRKSKGCTYLDGVQYNTWRMD